MIEKVQMVGVVEKVLGWVILVSTMPVVEGISLRIRLHFSVESWLNLDMVGTVRRQPQEAFTNPLS